MNDQRNLLQSDDEHLKGLVHDGSDMIAILDGKGNFKYVSNSSKTVLAIEPEFFPGKSVFEFIHPDDANRITRILRQTVGGKKIKIPAFRFQDRKGGWRWVETVLANLLNDPEVNGIVASSRDITTQMLLSMSLEASNQRYKYVTQATSDAIWDWDIKSGALYLAEGFMTIFGHPHEGHQKKYKAKLEFVHPRDRERVAQSIHQFIASNDVKWRAEYRYRKADGTFVLVSDRAFLIRDAQGKAVRMVGAMQDVSQRKLEKHRLRLLELVIAHASDSVLITEIHPSDVSASRIIYVNEAFTKMTGYTTNEVIGKTPMLLVGPKSDFIELDRLYESLRKSEACEITTINYRKNGEEFWNNFSVSPVIDADGNYTHWIAIQRDITASKLAEIKLKELNERLLVHTSAIESQNKSLREIAWLQSHKLRTPVARIMGLIALTDDYQSKDPELGEVLGYMQTSIDELDQVVKEIILKISALQEQPGT